MEVYKHLCHTAKSSTLWSGWKVNNPHPMPFAFKKKGPFENDRDFSSKVKSRGVEGPIILTKEEALTFLDNTLGICRSQVHAGGKSLDFLNNVIRQMKRRVPFTNINLLAGKFADFTAADFKHHIVSGQGGTCLWINPFIKVLLEQLGHVAFHIPGINHPISDIEKRTHISTIICDISYPGSQHLVDPGMRHPLHEALPLDFDRESPTYTFHKYKIKFFKTENESLLLCTPCSAPHPETWVRCKQEELAGKIRVQAK